ncbi:Uma2 family endonuclease [Aquiflexum sp.]|uniref:Uma2 family endonuclease n=1 Tax=Aquiflexum sp. TaxID=1872584 RepID=UPI003593AF64
METPNEKPLVKAPDISHDRHTYADYLTWEMEEMVELIKGKVFPRGIAAPKRIHQQARGLLGVELYNFLKGKKDEVYFVPIDVRLPEDSKSDDKIFTVVQPDICVICDPEKLDDLGCVGAPDLVVEVLSPGNKQLELQHKYEVYEESGVKEYWLLDPEGQTFLIYTLKDGKYEASRLMTSGDIAKSSVIHGFELDLEEFFGEIK